MPLAAARPTMHQTHMAPSVAGGPKGVWTPWVKASHQTLSNESFPEAWPQGGTLITHEPSKACCALSFFFFSSYESL